MTGAQIFAAAVPELLAAARARDHHIGVLTRQAMRDLHHYECPIGLRVDDAWVFVVAAKLESPNRYRAHWSLQNSSRERWERAMRGVVSQALGIASWAGVLELGRQPACLEKMTLQIVRLVPSSREFIRDDDNLAFSRKGSTDAMKRVGLLKDDRREWLEALSILQDVAPKGVAMTVFFLWPAAASLFQEPPNVQQRRQSASRQSHHEDGNPERRDDGRRRRQPRARATDARARA